MSSIISQWSRRDSWKRQGLDEITASGESKCYPTGLLETPHTKFYRIIILFTEFSSLAGTGRLCFQGDLRRRQRLHHPQRAAGQPHHHRQRARLQGDASFELTDGRTRKKKKIDTKERGQFVGPIGLERVEYLVVFFSTTRSRASQCGSRASATRATSSSSTCASFPIRTRAPSSTSWSCANWPNTSSRSRSAVTKNKIEKKTHPFDECVERKAERKAVSRWVLFSIVAEKKNSTSRSSFFLLFRWSRTFFRPSSVGPSCQLSSAKFWKTSTAEDTAPSQVLRHCSFVFFFFSLLGSIEFLGFSTVTGFPSLLCFAWPCFWNRQIQVHNPIWSRFSITEPKEILLK